MGLFVRKYHGEIYSTKIARLSIITFVMSITTSLIATIWAIYLDSFFQSAAIVGLLTASLTLISISSYFIFIPLLEKSNKSSLFGFSLVIFGITYLLFSIINSITLIIILSIIMTLAYVIRVSAFGLMIKDFSGTNQITRNEGIVYTFANLAWVIAPLIAGYIASSYGNRKIFLIAGIIILLTFLAFQFSNLNDKRKLKKTDKNILKNMNVFFKNKNLLLNYFLGAGVSIWWSLIYLFIPIYMIRNNLSTIWIGYFLFAIPLPLITLEYFFSKKASKNGFKKLFEIGFLIPCIIALVCFFLTNIYAILILLVIASIGIAMLEPNIEAYFFKILNKKEEQRFYGPFSTRVDMGSLIGKLIPALFLFILPLKYIFLFFSFAMFALFLLSKKIKESSTLSKAK